MATRTTTDLLNDSGKVIDTWTANTDFKMGDVTLANFKQARADVVSADDDLEARRTEIAGLLNDREEKSHVLTDLVQRARAGFKAVYGPDSTQYEQAGGTRRSERHSGLHRATKEKPVASS